MDEKWVALMVDLKVDSRAALTVECLAAKTVASTAVQRVALTAPAES